MQTKAFIRPVILCTVARDIRVCLWAFNFPPSSFLLFHYEGKKPKSETHLLTPSSAVL